MTSERSMSFCIVSAMFSLNQGYLFLRTQLISDFMIEKFILRLTHEATRLVFVFLLSASRSISLLNTILHSRAIPPNALNTIGLNDPCSISNTLSLGGNYWSPSTAVRYSTPATLPKDLQICRVCRLNFVDCLNDFFSLP